MLMKVTFHLDGGGLCYNPAEPIHLDALLAWVLAPKQGLRHVTRDEKPGIVQLPLRRRRIGEHWVWRASALFPEGEAIESVWRWRRRFRHHRADLVPGRIDTSGSIYRDWDTPIPLVHVRKMVAWADGSRRHVKKLLREVRYLGRKRAHGHGKVLRIEVDEVQEDYTLVRDGRAQRWLPDENGVREVRLWPPYWHPHGRVRCCEVGEPYELPPERAVASSSARA